MELHEIRRRIAVVRDRCKPGGFECRSLTEAIEMLEGMEEVDEPPVSVDDGFAILPMERYEALRQAEEHLQETRFAPSDGEHDDKQATIDALTRRLDGVCNESNARLKEIERLVALVRNLHRSCDEYQSRTHALQEEIGRLKGDAKVRAEAAAPLKPAGLGTTAGEPQFHPVLDKHLQDIQGEIEGIKDRLDEITRESRAVCNRTETLHDRVGVLFGRLNKLDAREGLDPILRDEARERDEATRGRLLQEVNAARKLDPS